MNNTFKEKIKKILENKKLLGICGGVAGVVIVGVIVLAIVLGNNKSDSEEGTKEAKIETTEVISTAKETEVETTTEEETTTEVETTTEIPTTQVVKETQPQTQVQKQTQPQTQAVVQKPVETTTAKALTIAELMAQAPVISPEEAKKLPIGHSCFVETVREENASYQVKVPTTRDILLYETNENYEIINCKKVTVKGYYYYDFPSTNPTFVDEGIDTDGDGIEDRTKGAYEVQREYEIKTFGKVADSNVVINNDGLMFNYFFD